MQAELLKLRDKLAKTQAELRKANDIAENAVADAASNHRRADSLLKDTREAKQKLTVSNRSQQSEHSKHEALVTELRDLKVASAADRTKAATEVQRYRQKQAEQDANVRELSEELKRMAQEARAADADNARLKKQLQAASNASREQVTTLPL
jgi:hypothetical protein